MSVLFAPFLDSIILEKAQANTRVSRTSFSFSLRDHDFGSRLIGALL